tara:strand:- start:2149 stop:2751 length:603 start_codon:yes stop_codon:yes gene_type:complete
MNLLLVPKVITRYKNQVEYAVEENLIIFLKKVFINCRIKIFNGNNLDKKLDLIVFTGGNTIKKFSKKREDQIRNKFDNIVFKFVKKKRFPAIGICHGAHFIASKYKSKFSIDRKHSNERHYVFFKKKKLQVNSYHNIKINDVTENLKINGVSHDNSIEYFQVKSSKLAGIIWHPERERKNINKQIKLFRNCYATISSSLR